MVEEMQGLVLREVRADRFAPFGTVVEMGSPSVPVNGGTALRHDLDAYPVPETSAQFRLVTSIFEAQAQSLPRAVQLLERHPSSRQLIMPICGSGHAGIVCLSRKDGTPDVGTLVAFRFGEQQGMIYGRGIWHHPILAIGRPARFLVQSWQDGTDGDCETVAMEPVTIAAESHYLERGRG